MLRGLKVMLRYLKELRRRSSKFTVVMKRPASRRAFVRHRVAATIEHYDVLSNLDLKMVVDIGANHGQFSLAVRDFHPDAVIVAFEPLPAAAAIYRKVFANSTSITLHQAAISPRRGDVTLHISMKDDSSSLLSISGLQTSIFPGTDEASITDVAAAPLSDFISDVTAPALLKIDVQGFELEVLIASESLLARFDSIYVEASFVELYEKQALAGDVIDFVQSRGFELAGIYNVNYTNGLSIQADFLFRNRSRRVTTSGSSSTKAASEPLANR